MSKQSSLRKQALVKIMKEAVYDACVRVLLRSGVDGMTMDAVAREAEVAKGTLYNYFQGKRQLLEYVHDSLLENMRAALDEIVASDLSARDKLRRTVEHVVAEFDRKRAILQLTIAEFGDHPLSTAGMENATQKYFAQLFVDLCRDAITEGPLAKLPADMLGRLFNGAILGLLQHRIASRANRPAEQDVNDFLDALLPATGGSAPVEGNSRKNSLRDRST